MGWSAGLSKVITAGSQAAGSIYGGYAAKSAYDDSAALLDIEADYQRDRGQFIAGRIRKKGKRLTSSQRAAMASQGMDPNTGSALDVLADAAGEVELDALLAEHEGAIGAWQARTQAGQYRSSGAMAVGKGYMSAVGQMPKLLTGISKWSWQNRIKANDWDVLGTLR